MRDVNRMREVVDFVERNLHRQHHFSAWRGAFVQHEMIIILRQLVAEKLLESSLPPPPVLCVDDHQKFGTSDLFHGLSPSFR
jgi:hypothetical protein